ncbi:MAG: hypothetical protein IT192_07195 [Microbacteriaceae bacterium]|nr:hypothetical protein [Microbacteriaceae bacterium]
MLIVTPLGLNRLGVTEFAYWLLATYVTGLVVSPDLGLGNGIVNEFGRAHRRGGLLSEQAARIRGLMRILFLIALAWFCIGALIAIVYASFAEAELNNVLFFSLVLGLFCYLSAIPASLVQRIQLSQEKANRSVLWEGIGKSVGLVTSLLILLLFPNLYLLIVAYMLPVSVSSWLNAYLFLKSHDISLVGRTPALISAFRANHATFQVGKWFVLMQISYLLVSALDLYVLNWLGSEKDVVYYNVTKRPFDLLVVLISMYAIALWPVFSRLNEVVTHRRNTKIYVSVLIASAAIVGLGGVAIILFGKPLYDYLGNGSVVPLAQDLIAFFVLAVSTSLVMICTNQLNAKDRIREQALIFLAGAVMIVVLKILAIALGDVHVFVSSSSYGYLIFIALPLLTASFALTDKSMRVQ